MCRDARNAGWQSWLGEHKQARVDRTRPRRLRMLRLVGTTGETVEEIQLAINRGYTH